MLCAGTKYFSMCALTFVGWWLITSALVYFAWNHVVCEMTKLKQAKYWQALLIIATLCALCAPRFYTRYCCQAGFMKNAKECPYSRDTGEDKK